MIVKKMLTSSLVLMLTQVTVLSAMEVSLDRIGERILNSAGSPEEAARWCRIALSGGFDKQKTLDFFKEKGIFQAFEKLAGEHNPHACYVMSGLSYLEADVLGKDVNELKIMQYLSDARHTVAPAYLLLVDMVNTDSMYLLSTELQKAYPTYAPDFQKHCAAKMQHQCRAIFWQEKSSVALQHVFYWYILGEAPKETVIETLTHLKENNGALLLDTLDKDSYAYLKKLGTADASCAYLLGSLFWQAAQESHNLDPIEQKIERNKNKAFFFWRAASKKKHVLATWSLLAHDPSACAEYSKIARELTQKNGCAEHDEVKVLAKTALVEMGKRACTAEELHALAGFYGQGLTGIIESNRKMALDYYKRGYIALYGAIPTDASADKRSKHLTIDAVIQALSGEKGATAEVLLAREALDELLTSLIERKLTVSEAVSLIQLYSRGIEGVCKPDAAKLLTIIKKVYETFKEVDDLKEICAQTKLLDQLTGTPSAVQYFVLSIKCALIEYELEKKGSREKDKRMYERQRWRDDASHLGTT